MPLRFANLFHVSIINCFFFFFTNWSYYIEWIYSLFFVIFFFFLLVDGYLFFSSLGLFYVDLLMNIHVKFYVNMFSIILSTAQF